MEDSSSSATYKFRDYVLDLDRGTLTRRGTEVPLRPKSFGALRYLVENRGKLVSRDELIEATWGHLHVSDSSLSQCLRDIRAALDDQEQTLIHTIPRRGYRFESPEDHGEVDAAEERPGRNAGRFPRTVGIALTFLLAGAVSFLALRGSLAPYDPAESAAAYASPISIAVLPLLDLSPDGNLAYLADGLAEEILNSLAQSDELRVIARTSSFAFRGENVNLESIARELEVDLVLEGSVRRSGDVVRVTTQLIDTNSQAHLWSRTYDHALSNLFILQSEVAQDVAAALDMQIQLTRQGDQTIPGAEAYEAFLLGTNALRREDPLSMEHACEILERATELAPEFAAAWSKLSDCYRRLAYRGKGDSEALFSAYLESVDRALTLDPNLPEADYLDALRLRFLGNDQEFQQAIAKGLESPHQSPLFLGLAMGDASDYGQFEAAAILGERVLRLDPLSMLGRNNLGYAYIAAGRHEEAMMQFEKLRSINPASDDWHMGKTIALIQLARYEEAGSLASDLSNPLERTLLQAIALWGQGENAQAAELIENNKTGDELDQLSTRAQWYAFTGQTDQALETLETISKQYKVECRGPSNTLCVRIGNIWWAPFLAGIRHMPRARAWISAYAPGYELRTEQRKTLYKPVIQAQQGSG